MTFIKKALLGAAGALAMTAGTASALTTIDDDSVQLTGGAKSTLVSQTTTPDVTPGLSTQETEITFRWNASAAAGYLTFTVNTTFDLILSFYSGNSDPKNNKFHYTGFVFGKVGGAFETDDTSFCSSSAISEIAVGTCDLASDLADSETPLQSYNVGTTLFANLGPGEYFLGFQEASVPTAGALGFTVAETTPAPIPLPAGGWLLMGALGGLAAMRRRRKAA